MIKHDGTNVLVFDSAVADNNYFYTGNYDTVSLDFDPFITGYSFFKWTKVPGWVQTAYPQFQSMTEKNFIEGFSLSDIELETSTISAGFAANEYNFATNSKKGNTEFSIKHREFSGSPIRNMYQHWVTGIRDPETGIATYPAIYGIDYAAKNHTGEIIYIVTRPDANNVAMNNIEYACYYTAVMPTKIQLSQMAYTSGTHDAVEYEQAFKGCFHMSAKIDEMAKTTLTNLEWGMKELGQFDPENVEFKAMSGSQYDDSKEGSSVSEGITTFSSGAI